MSKIKTVKLSVSKEDIEGGKNMHGENGEKCNNCGGYGYTMLLKGGKKPCQNCGTTGIRELSKEELQKEVYDLKQDIHMLRQALMQDLGFHGKRIPTNIKEANHAQ